MIDSRIFKYPNIGLAEFNNKKDKILIIRRCGGLGDIIMYRMMMEDIKFLFPSKKLYFACPVIYHDALIDHPYIDYLLDVQNLNKNDFLYSFETTIDLEALNCHKSDFWADYCGIKLKNHNTHIKLQRYYKTPDTVLIAPFSNEKARSITINQINEIIKILNKNVIIVHNENIIGVNADVRHDLNIIELFELINSVDGVISVDTSILHVAGSLNKPVIGLFGWTNGEIICKYYKNTKVIQFGDIKTSCATKDDCLSERLDINRIKDTCDIIF